MSLQQPQLNQRSTTDLLDTNSQYLWDADIRSTLALDLLLSVSNNGQERLFDDFLEDKGI